MDNRKRKATAPANVASTNLDEDEVKRRRTQAREDSTSTVAVQSSLNGNDNDTISEGSIAIPTVFVKRGANSFVPLIPFDELPHWIDIIGIRSQYTLDDVEAVQGQIVFSQKGSGTWKVDIDHNKVKTELDDEDTRNGQQVPSSKSINDRLSAVFANRPPQQYQIPPVANSPARRGAPTAASTTTQRYNPTTPGVLGQKVYCTHWMRTGECDFTQQGCMFLHCMPDLDTLEKLGFRAYPRWFREMPRQFQEQNSKEFSTDGLNPQRVQMREMQAMAATPPPPPPPPAPISRQESIYGTGRNAPSEWRQDNANQFPQFQPYSNFNPQEAVPLYNGLGQPQQKTSQNLSNNDRGRNTRTTGSTDGRSLLSRDGSREGSPGSTGRKLRAYEPLTPSIRGSEISNKVAKKSSPGFKAPSRNAIDSKIKEEKERNPQSSYSDAIYNTGGDTGGSGSFDDGEIAAV